MNFGSDREGNFKLGPPSGTKWRLEVKNWKVFSVLATLSRMATTLISFTFFELELEEAGRVCIFFWQLVFAGQHDLEREQGGRHLPAKVATQISIFDTDDIVLGERLRRFFLASPRTFCVRDWRDLGGRMKGRSLGPLCPRQDGCPSRPSPKMGGGNTMTRMMLYTEQRSFSSQGNLRKEHVRDEP